VTTPVEVPLISTVAPIMGRLSSEPEIVPVIVFCCAAAGSKKPQNTKINNRSFLIILSLGYNNCSNGINESLLLFITQVNVIKQIYNLLLQI
jgi:hypothetical protein